MSPRLRTGMLVALWLSLVAGCGKDTVTSMQQTATQVQQSVTTAVDNAQNTAQEQLQLTGSAEVALGETPLKTPACYAVFTPAVGERGAVLALRSYRRADQEVFPSFYLHAPVSATSLNELAGQTVPAQMYIKSSAEGPTWQASAAQPVQLKISAVADQQVQAEVVGGTLVRADGQGEQSAAGKFIAVVP